MVKPNIIFPDPPKIDLNIGTINENKEEVVEPKLPKTKSPRKQVGDVDSDDYNTMSMDHNTEDQEEDLESLSSGVIEKPATNRSYGSSEEEEEVGELKDPNPVPNPEPEPVEPPKVIVLSSESDEEEILHPEVTKRRKQKVQNRNNNINHQELSLKRPIFEMNNVKSLRFGRPWMMRDRKRLLDS